MRRVMALLAAIALLGGCGANTTGEPTTLTVFAAASLTEAFEKLAPGFEHDNANVKVRYNFGGSSALAQQINQGAPADVFAAASPATMKTVIDAGNGDAVASTFVRNQLVIAVPPKNPKAIKGLADLARPGLKVALCAEQVPCGAAAKAVLAAAGVGLTPVTLEQDVKAALAKVRLGEADAALVYRTDVRSASSDVEGVEFPESGKAINDYPIVVVKNAPNKVAAQAFVAYVTTGQGRAVLAALGFQLP
jgi:molybdate transport system substrate-binding protein